MRQQSNRTEAIELTVLCMVCQEGRILLQNRAKEDWKGYAFPGGHVEPGESIVNAVIREMQEETGLTVHQPKLCGVKQFPLEGGRYLVFLFRAEEFTGTLRSSKEGEMEWVERSHLDEYPLVEDMRDLICVMDQEDLTEFQYVQQAGDWEIRLY